MATGKLLGTPGRRLSAGAIVVLMALEAFRSMPYRDIVGVWTDGYGNTHNVVPGVTVSEPQARAMLVRHTEEFGDKILACLTREPRQGQYDSFILLSINIGPGSPGGKTGFCPSTVARRFNAGDESGACLAILKFMKAGGQVVRGLANRRFVEYNLCIADTHNWSASPWATRTK